MLIDVFAVFLFFFECYGDHRDRHVLTHSFPTRRSSDRYDKQRDWLRDNDRLRRDILDLLESSGPVSSRDIPDTCVVPWASTGWSNNRNVKIGRAHVWTPVTNAHLVCRLLLEKNNPRRE